MSYPIPDKEILVIAQVSGLPGDMQLIYLQLVSAMEASITGLKNEGATADLVKMEFVEALIDKLLDRPLSRQHLTVLVTNEIRRQLAIKITTG